MRPNSFYYTFYSIDWPTTLFFKMRYRIAFSIYMKMSEERLKLITSTKWISVNFIYSCNVTFNGSEANIIFKKILNFNWIGLYLFSKPYCVNNEQTIFYWTMNETADQLNCPIWTKRDYDIRDIFSFWVGGIAVCCVAVPGLFLNLTAICVLSTRVSTKNNFNQLMN